MKHSILIATEVRENPSEIKEVMQDQLEKLLEVTL